MIYKSLFLHSKIWTNLSASVRSNRLPHALLFYGNYGTGKEAHAIELAALINCELNSKNESCGKCSSCKKMKSSQHGNVKVVIPYPRGKISSPEDPSIRGLSKKNIDDLRKMMELKGKKPYESIKIENSHTILINSIREIKKDLQMSTIESGWRVILIFNAEKLCIPQPNAANALLKVLEEPPEKTLFILVTSDISNVIDTVRSRCQEIFFPPLPKNFIENELKRNEIKDEKIKIILDIANGNIKSALDLSINIDEPPS